jgi:hypothetical protein
MPVGVAQGHTNRIRTTLAALMGLQLKPCKDHDNVISPDVSEQPKSPSLAAMQVESRYPSFLFYYCDKHGWMMSID